MSQTECVCVQVGVCVCVRLGGSDDERQTNVEKKDARRLECLCRPYREVKKMKLNPEVICSV